MKKWIILSIIHSLGAIINAFLYHCFFNASVYSSHPLLQMIVDGPYTWQIYEFLMYTVIIIVSILTVIFIKLPRTKFYFLKLILVFGISCFISYIYFLILFYISCAIIFCVNGIY